MGIYSDLTDLELLSKISDQDSPAIEELYDRYSPLLYSLIKKIVKDNRLAEIILVDIFAIIWKKSGSIDFSTSSVYTWIITLARNRGVDNLRRTRSANKPLDIYDNTFENFFIIPMLDGNIDALDYNTAVSLRPKMAGALGKLTDAQKYVLQLAYYEGYTLDEISQKLQIPIEAVREKMMSAVHSLRQNLLGGK